MRSVEPVITIVHSDIAPDDPADEQDTLIVAGIVRDTLLQMGIRAETLPYRPETLKHELTFIAPDAIFNLVEAIGGRSDEAWRAPQFFSSLGYSFTGAGAQALQTTTDKLAAKKILTERGLTSPDWLSEEQIIAAVFLPGCVILKPCNEDASIGIHPDSVTDDADTLRDILVARKNRYGGVWFAERFIQGREVHVPLLEGPGNVDVLPPAEIDFSAFSAQKPRIIDYAAKWDESSFEYNNTPYLFSSLEPILRQTLISQAEACWNAFNLRGSARVDFRIAEDGQAYIIDINANPCLAPQCIFYHAAKQKGFDYPHILESLIKAAMTKPVGQMAAE